MYLGMNMLVQEKQSKVNMKLIKFIICFVLILSLNNNAKALSGVGPLSFSEGTFEWFLAYLRGDGQTTGEVGFRQGYPGGFAVNPEGTYGYYSYCPLKYGSGGCRVDFGRTVQACSKGSKARGGSRCKLFAKGYKVVWGGTNIKFSRKFDEQVVRSVFKQNGWYTGGTGGFSNWDDKYVVKVRHAETNEDFKAMSSKEDYAKELAMENCQSKFKSGCYLYSIKHKGKTKTFAKKVDTNQDTVKKLQDIKKMLDEGLITEAEFKKLKEEILN